MSTTINSNFITYNDGTQQQSANWKVIDGNTAPTATAYAVGTYLLCDTLNFNSKTNPMPLDGWGRYYSGPALSSTPSWGSATTTASVVYNSSQNNTTTGYSYYVQPCIMDGAYAAAGGILSGTWVSRGSCPTQAFVVRIA